MPRKPGRLHIPGCYRSRCIDTVRAGCVRKFRTRLGDGVERCRSVRFVRTPSRAERCAQNGHKAPVPLRPLSHCPIMKGIKHLSLYAPLPCGCVPRCCRRARLRRRAPVRVTGWAQSTCPFAPRLRREKRKLKTRKPSRAATTVREHKAPVPLCHMAFPSPPHARALDEAPVCLVRVAGELYT